MFKEIGSVFSFLTILPSSNSTLNETAKYMYLFPVVGIIIGILVFSIIAWATGLAKFNGVVGSIPPMTYLFDFDLKAALTRRHDIIDNVSDVLVQMADGLNHLHDRGWIHLDYKPENIMISLNGHVSLIDFDTAQKMPRKPKKYPKISGTPSYMPPEQLKGESVDQRADIYAWGSTAYELLTHLRPFGGRTPEESRRNQLDAKFRVKPVHQHNPQVPVALSQLIGNCLAHQPDARYPNMTVLNARLHSILGVQHQPVAEHSLALAS